MVVKKLIQGVDFRDGSEVYLQGIKRPSFLYDKTLKCRLKYGEFEDIEKLYLSWRQAYIAEGFDWMADDLAMVEVQPNQSLIDRLFQSSGEFSNFVEELNNGAFTH